MFLAQSGAAGARPTGPGAQGRAGVVGAGADVIRGPVDTTQLPGETYQEGRQYEKGLLQGPASAHNTTSSSGMTDSSGGYERAGMNINRQKI